MKISWYKGCKSEEDKAARRAIILAAAPALEILTGILEEKIRVIDEARNAQSNYTLPSYSEFQADCSGYTRGLRELLSLINLKE